MLRSAYRRRPPRVGRRRTSPAALTRSSLSRARVPIHSPFPSSSSCSSSRRAKPSRARCRSPRRPPRLNPSCPKPRSLAPQLLHPAPTSIRPFPGRNRVAIAGRHSCSAGAPPPPLIPYLRPSSIQIECTVSIHATYSCSRPFPRSIPTLPPPGTRRATVSAWPSPPHRRGAALRVLADCRREPQVRLDPLAAGAPRLRRWPATAGPERRAAARTPPAPPRGRSCSALRRSQRRPWPRRGPWAGLPPTDGWGPVVSPYLDFCFPSSFLYFG